jgi:hypothetical protein
MLNSTNPNSTFGSSTTNVISSALLFPFEKVNHCHGSVNDTGYRMLSRMTWMDENLPVEPPDVLDDSEGRETAHSVLKGY